MTISIPESEKTTIGNVQTSHTDSTYSWFKYVDNEELNYVFLERQFRNYVPHAEFEKMTYKLKMKQIEWLLLSFFIWLLYYFATFSIFSLYRALSSHAQPQRFDILLRALGYDYLYTEA
jgi:hypothetical protein